MKDKIKLSLSSTFTDTGLSRYISWWCEKFGIFLHLKFAPYNQVIQELLKEDAGQICVYNIRFEDFIRNLTNSTSNNHCQELDKMYAIITELLIEKEQDYPIFITLLPISYYPHFNEEVRSLLVQQYKKWKNFCENMPNIRLIDLTFPDIYYSIDEIFSSKADQKGHIPYSEPFFCILGTVIARNIIAWYKSHYKVIVVDCDNTLWKGACGECGPMGVEVGEEHGYLQRILIEKKEQGFLIALCSKNNEKDVRNVFKQNRAMSLHWDDIAAYRVNWDSKADNLSSISEELNLNTNSFLFIDDSPLECMEMQVLHPEILTINLPKKKEDAIRLINNIWAWDKIYVTEEDAGRLASYKAEKKRIKLKSQFNTLDDYIKVLDISINFKQLKEEELPRVSQLTQRTNQFNINGIKRSIHELKDKLKNNTNLSYSIYVKDRFGDYGLAGVILAEVRDKILCLETFLLSCRVLGRKIEHQAFNFLRQVCIQNDIKYIEVKYQDTNKNYPSRKFLESLGNRRAEGTGKIFIYEVEDRRESDLNQNCKKKYANLNHIGIAVRNIEKEKIYFINIGYSFSGIIEDKIQHVKLSIGRKIGATDIELVEAIDCTSPTYRIVCQGNAVPYHLCFSVDLIDDMLKNLEDCGIMYKLVSDKKVAPALNGKCVQFVYINHVGLVELLEGHDKKTDEKSLEDFRIMLLSECIEHTVKFYRTLGYHKDNNRSSSDTISYLAMNGSCALNIVYTGKVKTLQDSINKGLYIYALMFESAPLSIQKEFSGRPWYFDCIDDNVFCLNDWKYCYFYLKSCNPKKTDEIVQERYLIPLAYNSAEELIVDIRGKGKRLKEEAEDKQILDLAINITEIWKEVLELDEIGIDDDFFSFGGNSLKAIELEVRIEQLSRNAVGMDCYIYNTIKKQYYYLLFSQKEAMKVKTDGYYMFSHLNINNTFYHDCFCNALIYILKEWNKTILPLLANDIIVYDYRKKYCLGTAYYSFKDISEILQSMGIFILKKRMSIEIKDDIKKAMGQKKPIIIWVDCYYLPNRKDTYKKKHLKHAVAVLGYDYKAGQADVLEHTSSDKMDYAIRKVEIDCLCEAYNSFIKNQGMMTEDDTYFEFSFLGQGETVNHKEIISHVQNKYKVEIEKGIKDLAEYINDMEGFILDLSSLKLIISEVLDSLNSIINAKKSQLFACRILDETQYRYGIVSIIIEKWSEIRIVLLRFLYTGRFLDEDKELYFNNMKVILNSEKQLIQGDKENINIE